MGEVYRARDPRLRRDVALKVMRVDRASGDGSLRFEREARAAASLSHPNILTVHDVGCASGTAYVVTELLEGETLRAVASTRSPGAQEVLRYVIQVAQGLAAAHEKGIVHRDLKPENLFLTRDGRVKILDTVSRWSTSPCSAPGRGSRAGARRTRRARSSAPS